MTNKLTKYNQKRNFKETKEPIGRKNKSSKKLRFIIQHHIASKDHYDFRLEWNGTLKSWAVPKGPSMNTLDKRLAIQVEDHPISYRNFEGVIPKGQYGGGTVMIFDEGYWEPLEENIDLEKKQAIKFQLNGKRLKGKWKLIPYKEENWLLIKEKDQEPKIDINEFQTSIKTGRTMEEITKGIKKTFKKKLSKIEITNPDKIIFENPKITKLDIIKYYEKVAPRMLPFLESRIISTIRCPNGIKEDKFFKKHLENFHKLLYKIKLTNKSGKKDDYYYIKNIEGLISEVQMNSFEFHIWGSKVNQLEHPDMMVFDLDPDEKMNLQKIRQGVRDLKSILDEFSLASFLKTSGGKGYHVVVPMKHTNWKKFREIAKNIAQLMEMKWPEKYTSNIRKEERKIKFLLIGLEILVDLLV